MFIAQKEVSRVEGSTVYFEDGSQKEYTPKQLTYLLTEQDKEPTDYTDLIMDNIMPDVQAIIDSNLDEMETVGKILDLIEEHDLTHEETQWLIQDIVNNRIVKHNAFMEATVGKEIKQFEEEMKRYKDLCTTLETSHKRAMVMAVGKALGTYVEGEPFEDCWNSIRVSHIKQFI